MARNRKLKHILVDVLDIVGGGLVSAAISTHSWKLGILAGALLAQGLYFDRRNALEEDERL